MPGDAAAFLLVALLAAGFAALVALAAVAGAASWWSLRGALRRRRADRGLEALRERHYAEVAEHARRRPPAQADVAEHARRRPSAQAGVAERVRPPRIELDPVEFGGWPVLGEEPPIVFPRRRAA